MATPNQTTADLNQAQLDLVKKRQEFILQYMKSQIQAERDLGKADADIDRTAIRTRAEQTASTLFGEPLAPNQPAGFGGDYYQRTRTDFGLPAYKQYAPSVTETVDQATGQVTREVGLSYPEQVKAALSPQERQITGTEEKKLYAPFKLDWAEIENNIASQTTPEEARASVKGFQEGFAVIKSENPKMSDEEAFSELQKQLSEIEGVSKGTTRPYLSEPKKGPADPLYQAFQQDVRKGKVPDFNPTQAAIIKGQLDEKAQQYVDKNYKVTLNNPTIEHVKIKGYDYPKEVVEYIQNSIPGTIPTVYSETIDQMIRDNRGSSPYQIKPSARNAETLLKIQAYGQYGNDNWIYDPVKKDKILKDPDKYIGEGILTKTTAFGGEKETDLGWGLRSAFAPITYLGAAGIDLLLEGGALVSDDIAYIQDERKRLRQEQTPDFADSPALASLATGRGIAGDLMQIGEMMNLDLMGTETKQIYDPASGQMMYVTTSGNKIPDYVPLIGGTSVYKTAYDAGSLLTDLLDPSYAVIGAGVKGLNTYSKLTKAQKSVYGTQGVTKAANLKKAAATAAKFVDDDINVLSVVANRTLPKNSPIKATLAEAAIGDVRLAAGEELAKSFKAREIAKNANTFDEAVETMKLEGVDNTTYGRLYQEKVPQVGQYAAFEELDKTILAGKAAPESVKAFQEYKSTNKFLDDLRMGQSFDNAKAMSAELGEVPNFRMAYESLQQSAARFGKKSFDELTGAQKLVAIDEAQSINRYLHASDIVFKETPGLSKVKNLRKVTRRLYASVDDIPKIIDAHISSPLGELYETITRQPLVLDRSARTSTPAALPLRETVSPGPSFRQVATENAYSLAGLDAQTMSRLEAAVNGLDISEIQKKAILKKITKDGVLPMSDYRLMVERNLENMALGMNKGVGLDTIGKLPESEYKFLTERDLFKEILDLPGIRTIRDVTKKMLQDVDVDAQVLTPLQREFVREVQQAASGVDARFKRAIAEGKKQGLTGQQAVGRAIVGEVDPNNLAMVTSVANTQANAAVNFAKRLIYEEKSYQSPIGRYIGINQTKTSDFFNEVGKAELSRISQEFGMAVVRNPENYLQLLNKFLNDYKDIASKGENLVVGVNPSKVRSNASRLIERAMSKLPETSIILYTSAETERIIKDKIVEMFDRESKGVTLKERYDLGKAAGAKFEGFYETFQDGIKNYATTRFNPNNVDIREDLRAIIEGFAINAADSRQLSPAITLRSQASALSGFKPPNGMDTDMFFDVLINSTEGGVDIYNAAIRAREYAETIMTRNGLYSTKMTADDVKILFDSLFSAKGENYSRILFGDLIYDDLVNKLKNSKMDINTQIDRAFGDLTAVAKGLNYAKEALGMLNSMRYTFILGLAPRFHGTNNATALGIVYATTGRFVNPDQLRKGSMAVFGATTPGDRWYYSVAVTDPAGRQYTYGDIYSQLAEAGVRSEYNWLKSYVNNDDLINYLRRAGLSNGAIDWMKGVATKPGSSLQELTTAEDLMFRAAVVIRELEEGKSLDDAIAMGRKSMYDYNDMYDFEKALAAYAFIFYSFGRQNCVAFLQSIMDGTLKPYVNTLKFRNGFERMLVKDNDGKQFNRQAFIPDYLSSKVILKKEEGVEKDWIITSPNLPPIDAMVMTLEIAKSIIGGQTSRIPRRMANPNIELLLGLEDEGKFEAKKVPSTYGAALMWYYGSPENTASALELIVGGKVTPRRSTAEGGGSESPTGEYWIFPLDPQQSKAYEKQFAPQNFLGMTRPKNDFLNVLFPESSKAQKLTVPEGLGMQFGVLTPGALPKPEQQALYDLYARRKALEDELQKSKSEAKKAQESKRK